MALTSEASRPKQQHLVLLGVAVTAMASLIIELALTRLFSVLLYYHFAFMAISVALLGLGAGGLSSYWIAGKATLDELWPVLARLSAINAFVTVIALTVVLRLQISVTTINWNNLPPLAGIYIASMIPFFFAGVIMYGIARFQGAPKPEGSTWWTALIIGACLLLGGNGGVTISEKWVPTGLAALLVATVPIYIALLGWLSGTATRPTSIVWLGLIGGFIGVGILVGPAFTSSTGNHLAWGMSILLIASLLWSVGSLYSRKA